MPYAARVWVLLLGRDEGKMHTRIYECCDLYADLRVGTEVTESDEFEQNETKKHEEKLVSAAVFFFLLPFQRGGVHEQNK